MKLVWISFFALCSFASSAAWAGLAADVGASCDSLKTDRGSTHADKVSERLFAPLLGCNRLRSLYKDDGLLSDPQKQEKLLKGAKPSIRGDLFVYLDAKYDLTELEKLAIAQKYSRSKIDRNAFLRDPGPAVLFNAVFASIDESALKKEISAAPFAQGDAKKVLRLYYPRLAKIHRDWLAFEKGAGEEAAVIANAMASLERFYQDGATRDLKARLVGIADKLYTGAVPGTTECEGAILAGLDSLAGLAPHHPLMTLSAYLGSACAAARGEEELKYAMGGLIRAGDRSIGPLGALLAEINRTIESLAEKANRAPALRPSREIRYVYGSSSPIQEVEGLDPNLIPAEGPAQIHTVKKVSYKGLPFVLVRGKGMKVRVPVMNCTSTQLGWKVDNGTIEKKMGTSCTFTGKFTHTNITFPPLLVPEAFARHVKSGSWMRFKKLTSKATADLSQLRAAAGKDSVFFAIPVHREPKLESFTADQAKMQRWDSDLYGLRN